MTKIASQPSGKSAEVQEYDLVILGSGAGGKLAAWTYGKQGKRVAVIERKYIGGACPNIACLPSKNIIHSAKVDRVDVVDRVNRQSAFVCGWEDLT
jgi:pyruvate/2-oxoglutarate dehydrogenase complex dihydrolipoamide dehydrogenase (E3) component